MAASTPKVSVLLPSLNARKFLEPRVDSLRKQTLTNWEAIVLDSHSTDGTWEFFKAVAETDSRFRLHQIPRDGVYAALNRGLELATGEFVYVATADDTMEPDFLAKMIEALGRCPNAGLAVCDCLFINQNGHELRAEDMSPRLSKRQIRNLLRSGTVRSSLPDVSQDRMNYRPSPHDCLLHFTARSVYFSLTQLLVRTESAKAAGLFETNASSAADFGWLVRLTSLTGTVHLPERLATWRFHGDQLSLQRDASRLGDMYKTCQDILPTLRQCYPGLLTDRDCEQLLLPFKKALSRSLIGRLGYWLQAIGRSQPVVAILRRKKLVPRDLEAVS